MEFLPIDMDSINLNQLLEADSESAPSGVDLEYDPLFGEMERAAKGKEERQVGDDLVAAEEPDWPKLKRLATEVLERSKDLRAAVQLTRAMIRTDGFAGLASGLALIKGYIDSYWETLHPQLDPDDENDPTIRINTLLNLCDPIAFILPLSKLPLLSSPRLGAVSYRDIQIANGAIPLQSAEQSHLSREQIDGAFRSVDPKESRRVLAATQQSIEMASGIAASVNSKVANEHSLDLQPLIHLLTAVMSELQGRSTAAGADPFAGTQVPASDPAHDNAVSTSQIQSRDDVIRSLDLICQYYALREPSSPVPLLLQRARNLVSMDFKEIVHDLAPEGQSHFEFLLRQDDG
jgi:type VI secretion system protein ImpA